MLSVTTINAEKFYSYFYDYLNYFINSDFDQIIAKIIKQKDKAR